jgi:Uma2 family endonuclease
MSLLVEHASIEEISKLAVELDGRPIPGLRMTEREFEAWCTEDVKAEWVDGEVIVMAPVSGEHSRLNVWLLRLVGEFVEQRNLGDVFGSELQVRLSNERKSLRERRCPDVMYVAKSRLRLLEPNYFNGAPDFIMEIVSPESKSRDWRDKYLAYEAAGVREYWIVDKSSERVEAYTLSRTGEFVRIVEANDRIESKVLRGFHLRPSWLWKYPLPKLSAVMRGMKRR